MVTTRHVDLDRLARTYAARAQPLGGLTDPEDVEPREVEVRILHKVHDAVRKRAARQNQVVADVARAVLFSAAARVTKEQIRDHARHRELEIKAAGQRAADYIEPRARRAAGRQGLTGPEAEQFVRQHVLDARQHAEDKERNARGKLRDYLGTSARYRLRFTAPAAAYAEATQRLAASGQTLVTVIENGLREYARTGDIH